MHSILLHPQRRRSLPIALVIALFTAVAACPPAEPWRSLLYPEDWEPGFEDAEGRFLHDFSYAGYRNGEEGWPEDPPGATYDVVTDYGADDLGIEDATAAIQAAIDDAGAAGGGVVLLPVGLYRCDGLLTVDDPGVVLRGEGESLTQVFFTSVEGMWGRRHLTFRGSVSQGPDLPLAMDGENRSNVVYVEDASSLAVGDDIAVGWVITDAFVAEHGMTGTWEVFNGSWRPIFRRQVAAVDLTHTPHAVTLDVPLRYAAKVRDQAGVRRESGFLEACGLEALSIANAVAPEAAWAEERVHAVAFQGVKDCWVSHVGSFPTPYPPGEGAHLQSGGIYVQGSKRVTVADCRMEEPQNRGGGGCGYLFELSSCNDVLVRDCVGRRGRHNFIQNWDFGTTGCVFLRCESTEGHCRWGPNDPIGYPCYSEYHHSLAMACLVDSCSLGDGWYGGNRRDDSSGAGHTVTQNVYWNVRGPGLLRSFAYGWGYVIGTQDMMVTTDLIWASAEGTAPEDWVEGRNMADTLEPLSLYEDQLARRLRF